MPRQQKNVNESNNEPVNNNPIRNETESSPGGSNEQTPRRSARLMKRQRDNVEETETDNENGHGNGNDTSDNNSNSRTSRNTRTRTSNSTSTDIRSSTSNITASSTSNIPSSSTSNNASSNSASASATATATATAGQSRTARPRTTRTARSQSQSPFPFMSMPVPIVFSFGIRARPSNSENTQSTTGTPDFHMIFNTNGPSTEELEQLIRNSTANIPSTRVRTASFVFPLNGASTPPLTSTDPATQDFIRQMFTSMPPPTPATSANRTASDSGIDEEMEVRLTEFARGIVQLMMTSRSNYADDEFNETLNNLVSRVFGTESVPRGLTPERINALPVMEAGTEVDCAICRETSTAGAGAADKCVKLPCDHGFHFECIEPWLKRVSSCPICRSEIKE